MNNNHINTATPFLPTDPKNRIEQIDILRGFALFGVLLVNVFGYNSSFFDFNGFYQQFHDPLNSTIFSLIIGYAADKFIFIFSFLFGIGFAIMYLKYQSDENSFVRLYSCRLMALMFFGIIHIIFFWAGDILFSYSLMGFLLLSLRKLPSNTILFASIFLYLFPIVYIAFESIYSFLPSALNSVTEIKTPEVIDIYSSGTYIEILKLRIHEYFAFRNINLIYYAPKILSSFLIGFLFYKHHFLQKINSSQNKYSIIFLILFSLGILLTIFTDSIVDVLAKSENNPFYIAIYMAIFEFSNLLLGFSYILLILILSKAMYFKILLHPLKYIGRTALSNYLLQSIIFTTIMYSYGFGQFGSLQPWQLIILAIVLYFLQIIISKYWLKHHRFGPMEWIWRKLTYGK